MFKMLQNFTIQSVKSSLCLEKDVKDMDNEVLSVLLEEIQTQLIDLSGKIGAACADVLVAGLTVFALRWAVIKIMDFFVALGGSYDEPEYDEDGVLIGEPDPEGWTEEMERAYRGH